MTGAAASGFSGRYADGPADLSIPLDDDALVAALRRGDDAAFTELVNRYSPEMLRFARLYGADQTAAEDSLQDAWLGVLRAVARFERRSSLRTWIFRIFVNRLQSRLERDARLIPFSRLAIADEPSEPALPPDRFLPADHPRWPRHWKVPPASWGESPEEQLLSKEAREVVERAVATLPVGQREVITLRDIGGWSASEVCEILDLGEANQRVLLHRARCKVRRALEDYFRKE